MFILLHFIKPDIFATYLSGGYSFASVINSTAKEAMLAFN